MKTFSETRKKCFNGRHSIRRFLFLPVIIFLLFPPLICRASQQDKITLSLKDVPIVEFFKEVEKITTYKFFYKNSQVENIPKISVEAKDQSLASVLNSVFSKTELTYTLNDKQIIIQDKTPIKAETEKITVTGKVTFADDGTAAPSANIMVKGVKGAGTITNDQGV